VADWLRTSLRDWAEDLLDGRRLEAEGFLAADRVQRIWREHLSGRTDHAFRLWGILCFQAWYAHVNR